MYVYLKNLLTTTIKVLKALYNIGNLPTKVCCRQIRLSLTNYQLTNAEGALQQAA